MLIGSLLRFSSDKDGAHDDDNSSSDDLMPRTLSEQLASISDRTAEHDRPQIGHNNRGLDEVAETLRSVLMDENLKISEVSAFFGTMVETCVDRFQVFPIDVVRVLFDYLELRDYPEEELRDLVKRLEKLYKKQHGRSLRKSERRSVYEPEAGRTLDEETSQLRETLKYAAIVGERLDD